MPLVRISHVEVKPSKFAVALSQGVHQAMVDTFNVPQDDYFQIVTDHAVSRGVIGPESFLGIEHSPELVMIQITCAEGRSVEQRKRSMARSSTISRPHPACPERMSSSTLSKPG